MQKQTKFHLHLNQYFIVKLAQRHLNVWHHFKNVVILFHITIVIGHFLLAHLTFKAQNPHQLIPVLHFIQAVQVFMTDLY
jgi:hypothetical protein